MTLGDRLNKIIDEQELSKREFARRVGISENYLYILTGHSRPGSGLNKTISPMLAKLIAVTFGYREEWILQGELPEREEGPSENRLMRSINCAE